MANLRIDHPLLSQSRRNKPLLYPTNLSSSCRTASSTITRLQYLSLPESRESQRDHRVLHPAGLQHRLSRNTPNFPIHLRFLIACARPPVFSISSLPVQTLIIPCVRNAHKPYFQTCNGNLRKQRRKEMVILRMRRSSGERRNGTTGCRWKMPKRQSKS